MASSSITSLLTSYTHSSTFPHKSSPAITTFRCTLRPCLVKSKSLSRRNRGFCIKAKTLDFASSLFDGDFEENGGNDDPVLPLWMDSEVEPEPEPEPECPPGLRKYETMVVLRPDMSEDERITLTQKYEELLAGGGAMYVQVFNRGVIPLAYDIKKRNKDGEKNTYMDGIYLLFTYCTEPTSLSLVEETLKRDDNVIRSHTMKVRKRKY